MHVYHLFLIVLGIQFNGVAQVENSGNTRFIKNTTSPSSQGYQLSTDGLSKKKNNFTISNDSEKLNGLSSDKKSFSMNEDNGLLGPEKKLVPKTFDDGETTSEGDQYFGDFKSKAKYVRLIFRDYAEEDGDLVNILLNDEILRKNVYLYNSFKSVVIDLEDGFNKIDVIALNQGYSGGNTAEFKLIDDQDNVIISNSWSLIAGRKASMIVVK